MKMIEELKNRLIFSAKGVPEDPEEIVIVGNGAVIGGWDPINQALVDLYEGHHPDMFLVSTADLFRAFSCQVFLNSLGRTKPVSHDSELQKLFKCTKTGFDLQKRIRKNIADCFINAFKKGGISLRPVLQEIRDSWSKGSTVVITTNWDRVLLKKYESGEIKNLIYPNGLSDYSETLLFPSEICLESENCMTACDHLIFLKNQAKCNSQCNSFLIAKSIEDSLPLNWKNFIEREQKEFIAPRAWSLMGANHHVSNILQSKKLKKVFIWGSALHAYDSAILSFLYGHSCVFKKDVLEELVLINPSKEHMERAFHFIGKVYKRVVHHTPRMIEVIKKRL